MTGGERPSNPRCRCSLVPLGQLPDTPPPALPGTIEQIRRHSRGDERLSWIRTLAHVRRLPERG